MYLTAIEWAEAMHEAEMTRGLPGTPENSTLILLSKALFEVIEKTEFVVPKPPPKNIEDVEEG